MTAESRTKKKIKSVKVLPPALKYSAGVDSVENVESFSANDSKVRNDKKELQRWMKIYDLV